MPGIRSKTNAVLMYGRPFEREIAVQSACQAESGSCREVDQLDSVEHQTNMKSENDGLAILTMLGRASSKLLSIFATHKPEGRGLTSTMHSLMHSFTASKMSLLKMCCSSLREGPALASSK